MECLLLPHISHNFYPICIFKNIYYSFYFSLPMFLPLKVSISKIAEHMLDPGGMVIHVFDKALQKVLIKVQTAVLGIEQKMWSKNPSFLLHD